MDASLLLQIWNFSDSRDFRFFRVWKFNYCNYRKRSLNYIFLNQKKLKERPFAPLTSKIATNLRHFSTNFSQNRLNLVALACSLFVHWIVLVPIFHRQRPQAAARTFCISLSFPSPWNLLLASTSSRCSTNRLVVWRMAGRMMVGKVFGFWGISSRYHFFNSITAIERMLSENWMLEVLGNRRLGCGIAKLLPIHFL